MSTVIKEPMSRAETKRIRDISDVFMVIMTIRKYILINCVHFKFYKIQYLELCNEQLSLAIVRLSKHVIDGKQIL